MINIKIFKIKKIFNFIFSIKKWRLLFNTIIRKKKHNFLGGIKCFMIKDKYKISSIKTFPLSKKFFISIKNGINLKNRLRISINQKVLRGQPLIFGHNHTVPVHAPTSGWIEDIIFYSDIDIPTQDNITIIIRSDTKDSWIRVKTYKNYKNYTPDKLIKIIYQSGIIGLGGAKFSSSKKLLLSLNKVHTLIVNAVESDPYTTSDECLIHNYIEEILIGCEIIAWITKVNLILIAVQDDKLTSISIIKSYIKNKSLFKMFIITNKYPAGSSKIIIQALTGKDIPHGQHAIDMGYLIFNIATIYSIKRAIFNGEPLTNRIVTIDGNKSTYPGNFWIRIGTPLVDIIHYQKCKKYSDLIFYLGGFFMGEKTVYLDNITLKSENCILIMLKKEADKKSMEYQCIRCGYCSELCPVSLLPQQLYWYSKANNHIKTKEYYILDCIECGICEKVCPSNIPLIKYFKHEKKIHYKIDLQNHRQKISLLRFNTRQKRLLEEKNIVSQIARKEQIQLAIQRMKKKS
ncbi:Ion-translocating oxidoreductase complex subunit C [Buchnera aphidicola (Cavariella theobaldi)]